ncbi:hypothetical protein [Trabulsiella odontotermitis]|uniref:Uncharacterized protein n=1 Tax=Trabulsiella odontotermitis TaxID=379893 RepID=A0A0L0GJW6_9ENTR|nr:hypothetical protein [Trabulsiella odontotermitis]KNC89430.1 hypothetical protein GM31_07530 [Trabulsiella odontotermitis]
MSLETNLELNNKLLTQHNALLERLIIALASGVALRPDTVAQVQEYRETVPETGGGIPVLDDLEFGDVVALAVFYPEPQAISLTMLQRAIDYRDATGDARVLQIDALDMALQGVKRAKELHNAGLLDLSRHILNYWDDLPTITDRRSFAEQLLDTKAGERDGVKPKKASSKTKQQERKGPFFVQHDDGKIGELSTEAELKTHLDAGYTEINKVEYLQLKEDAEKVGDEQVDDQPDFAALRKQAEGLILQLAKGGYRTEAVAILEKHGAKKLGEVADDKLADVVDQAEKALEG